MRTLTDAPKAFKLFGGVEMMLRKLRGQRGKHAEGEGGHFMLMRVTGRSTVEGAKGMTSFQDIEEHNYT